MLLLQKSYDQYMSLGQAHLYPQPVALRPPTNIGTVPSVIENTLPQPSDITIIPLAYGRKDIIGDRKSTRHLTSKHHQLFLGLWYMPSHQVPCEPYSMEWLITPGETQPRFVTRHSHHAAIFRHAFEQILLSSEVLPDISYEEDEFVQRVEYIRQSPELQNRYDLLLLDGYPQVGPHELITPLHTINEDIHPLQPIVAISKSIEDIETCVIQLLFAPVDPEYHKILQFLYNQETFTSNRWQQQDKPDKIDIYRPGFACRLRAMAIVKKERKGLIQSRLGGLFHNYRAGNKPFQCLGMEEYQQHRIAPRLIRDMVSLRCTYSHGFLATDIEISCLFPMPNWNMYTDTETRTSTVMLDRVPRQYGGNERITIGYNPSDNRSLEMPFADLFPGIFLIGASGTGKTTAMLNLLHQFVRLEPPVSVLVLLTKNPIRDVAEAVGKDIFHRCVIVDPKPEDNKPIGFNLLDDSMDKATDLRQVIQNLAENQTSSTSWGDQMDELAENILKLCASFKGATLAHARQALIDDDFLQDLLNACDNDELRSYFELVVERRKRLGRESNTSVTNRMRHLTNAVSRHILCQTSPTADMGELINTGKIIILDYKMDTQPLPELTRRGLSASLLYLGAKEAMSRPDTGKNPTPFIMLCDEAPSYFTPGVGDIVAEGRSFRCMMISGTQYISRYDESIIDSLFSCQPLKLIYQLPGGTVDPIRMSKEAQVPPSDIIRLPRYECIATLGRETYHVKGLPPIETETISEADIRRLRQMSSEQYGGKPVELDKEYYQQIIPKQTYARRDHPKTRSRRKSTKLQ